MKEDKQTEMGKCNHKFQYQSETVKLVDVNKGWFEAKRVIIFCENCGIVTHDQVNSSSSNGQNYSHKNV